jgi:hypothetical protein
MAEKIDLVTADLGRHLKNGEIISNEGLKLGEAGTVLNSNFYSYTHPDFPFLNHHWASGVIFFWIYELTGFSGLSLFYIILSAVTFSVFFYIAVRESNFPLAALFSFFLIPLMAERHEIRPEGFSCFFAGIFFLVLWLWQKNKISGYWLIILPISIVFWVNLHVYFFLGIFLIGALLFSQIREIVFSLLTDEEFQKKLRKIKRLFAVLLLVSLSTLANPFGFKLTLHPFNIYKNYGYTVLEEKSVWFLENYGIMNPNFTTVKTTLVLLTVGFIFLFLANRKKVSIWYIIMAIFFGTLGWMALRNFSLLGFFALPLIAYLYFNIFRQKTGEVNIAKEYGTVFLYFSVILIGLYANYQFVSAPGKNFGVGLEQDVQKAAEFFRDKKISGPIFNDYDIGGYLIWNLFPEEKVFVDNRPEVYPNVFFSDIYKPMQENPDVFKKVDEEYNFNAVMFYRNDITPWGMNFLKMIKENKNWVLVYSDNYAIIYLKDNELNQPTIEKFQIK